VADSPFLGPSYALDSRPASVQRTVNLIPVPLEPGNERTRWVFKDVPGLTAITTTSPPPLLDYLWLLHFDNTLDDETETTTFEADNVTSDGGANSFTYTTDSKFGAAAGRFPGTNNHIRSATWTSLQLATFDWQLEGWLRPRDVASDIAGPVINTGSLQIGGNVIGPGAQAGQFDLELLDTGLYRLKYATAIGNSTASTVGSPTALVLDTWNHFAICSDSTSLRLYSNGTLVAQALGVRPYAGSYDSQQRFFIGNRYTGGIPPLETYVDRYHGDMDEMRMLNQVTYTGSSHVVPFVPFALTDRA
jgi:hypothetical protein